MSKPTETNKRFISCATDTEGLKRYRAASEESKAGTSLTRKRVDGIKHPAIQFEVDKETYKSVKREEWIQEDRAKQEKRCIICGANGVSRRCPTRIKNPDYTGKPGQLKTIPVDCTHCPYEYDRLFKPVSGNVNFSDLDQTDDNGDDIPYEPVSPANYYDADGYLNLLEGFIRYLGENYPEYARYTELMYTLGQEVGVKEASESTGIPIATVYWFTKKIRPLFDEYYANTARAVM